MAEQKQDRSIERVYPEEIGVKITFSSVGALVAIAASWAIINLFFLSATLKQSNVLFTVLISLVLTFALPAIIYKFVNKYIKNLSEDILMIGNISERGEDDRLFVGAALTMAFFGLILYIGIQGSIPQSIQPIEAIEKRLGIPQIVNVILYDLMTVAAFGVFAGALLSAYHRYRYPRACWNCGNTDGLSRDYCGDCREPLENVPSRTQAIISLLKNSRSHYPYQKNENDLDDDVDD